MWILPKIDEGIRHRTNYGCDSLLVYQIKGKGICQDKSHLPMELYSEAKANDNIGWDSMMRVGIDLLIMVILQHSITPIKGPVITI